MHAEMALAVSAAGKHAFNEKALLVALAGAEEKATAARAKGIKTMVAFNNVKTPAAMRAKQVIDRGDAGTLIRFRGWFDPGIFDDPELPTFWRRTPQGNRLGRTWQSRQPHDRGRAISLG